MLRLSKLTDYATLVMTTLAHEPDSVLNATELARRTHVAEPTVRKTLKRLCRHELLNSVRGAHGGYRLARAASEISVADIIDAMEGPLSLTECAHGGGQCALEHHCGVRGHWQVINRAISNTLRELRLSDMVSPLPLKHLAA